jgi:hypothetical protein
MGEPMSATNTVQNYNDPNNFSDPPNWSSLIWRLTKTRPAFWMFASLSLYVGVRIYSNVDLLDPVIDTAQRTAHLDIATAVPDLSGAWEYTSQDKSTGKAWGGVINISVSKYGRIEKITVKGSRTWEAENAGGQHIISPVPIPWEADATYLVDKNQVEWNYITHDDRAREGVAFVHTNEGKLEGMFSDLYETQPRWGFQELQRRKS